MLGFLLARAGVDVVADVLVSQERSKRRHRLTQAIRSIAKGEREAEICAALAEIAESERRNELKRRFQNLSTDDMQRMFGD
jgi:hypothetical protein